MQMFYWKTRLKKILQRWCGVPKLQEQIDTLNYFLNQLNDVSQFETKNEALRMLQMCDVELLRIFHLICKKNHWKYWLDFGTLLGARRHRGFIPWDDDLDVCTPRDVYLEMQKNLQSEMENYGIQAQNLDGRIGVGYRHDQTGTWLDVFPVEKVKIPCSLKSNASASGKALKAMLEKIPRAKNFYFSRYNRHNEWKLVTKQYRILGIEYEKSDDADYILYGLGHNSEKIIMESSIIFPLGECCFGGYQFCVPHDMDRHLNFVFGSDFMNFPKYGIARHGCGTVNLYDRAERNNVDMNLIYEKLRRAADEIESKINQGS